MAEVAIVQQTARTGTTGTQDFTVSGFGTPKGALFFVTYGTAAGTAVDHAMLCMGATDGSEINCVVSRSEDNVTPSDSTNHDSRSNVIRTVLSSDGTSDGLATWSAWITDGVRINWTDVPPAGYLVTCILFGGTGISNVASGYNYTTGVLNTAVDINTLGFQPDVVLLLGHYSSINDASNSNSGYSIGWGVRGDAQRTVGAYDLHALNPTQCGTTLDTSCAMYMISSGIGADEASIEDYDASGFSVYQRILGVTQMEFIWFAFKLNGITAKTVTFASPTGTGSHSITGAGFTPQFGLMAHCAAQAANTIYTDGDSEVFGVSAFTAAAQASVAVTHDDAVATTNTESITDTKPVSLRKDGAAFMTADFTAFTSDGVTFNYTASNGSARQRAVLFLQESSGPPPVVPFVTMQIRKAP